MRKYLTEGIVLLLQLLMFYVSPLLAGPTDAMGMVFLIILATLVLSAVLGSVSGNRVKFLYPIVIAVLFIPSVFIHYNESALLHSVWYLVVSAVGLLPSSLIRYLICKR